LSKFIVLRRPGAVLLVEWVRAGPDDRYVPGFLALNTGSMDHGESRLAEVSGTGIANARCGGVVRVHGVAGVAGHAGLGDGQLATSDRYLRLVEH
jgi:hypothetical protein